MAEHKILNGPKINLKKLHANVSNSIASYIAWLQKNGLLSNVMFCDSCGLKCSLVNRPDVHDGKCWKCKMNNCR